MAQVCADVTGRDGILALKISALCASMATYKKYSALWLDSGDQLETEIHGAAATDEPMVLRHPALAWANSMLHGKDCRSSLLLLCRAGHPSLLRDARHMLFVCHLVCLATEAWKQRLFAPMLVNVAWSCCE
jgi:hypothetical protein